MRSCKSEGLGQAGLHNCTGTYRPKEAHFRLSKQRSSSLDSSALFNGPHQYKYCSPTSVSQATYFSPSRPVHIMMSFQIATEIGQSYDYPNREQDDESTDILGFSSKDSISRLNSSYKHPKAKSRRQQRSHDSQTRTLGTQALTTAPLLDGPQEQGSGWWHELIRPKGYALSDEIDLTDMAILSSSTLPPTQPPNPSGDHPCHSPAHSHSHSHAGTDGHDSHYGHSHSHAHDYQHHHDTPDERHSPTHPDGLQSFLPDGATRYMTAMSGCVKKRVVSAFQPPEDPCAPETSLACLLWSCALTIAESKGNDADHHDHSHSHHEHTHDHSHSLVHTEQYHSHPPLPSSMADWADRCSEPCLNDDGTVCTELYHGDATRGHSHM